MKIRFGKLTKTLRPMPLAAGLAQAGDRHFRLRQFLFPIRFEKPCQILHAVFIGDAERHWRSLAGGLVRFGLTVIRSVKSGSRGEYPRQEIAQDWSGKLARDTMPTFKSLKVDG